MRRKDREVTDKGKTEQIIKDCRYCRIGLNDNGRVYIVPMNFGYEINDGKYIFYFHSAGRGRKIDIIKNSPCGSFEADTGYGLNTGEIACDYSAHFRSVFAEGQFYFVTDKDEKIKGLNLIMKQATGKDEWTYSENALKEVTVIRFESDYLTAKEHG